MFSVAGLQTFSMANALGQTTLVPQEGSMWLPGNQVVLHGKLFMYSTIVT